MTEASSTTAVSAVPSSPRHADPGERGTTTVADTVVEKVAAHAATEVGRATGLRRSVVGVGLGPRAVRAHADTDGSVTSLRLDLGVEWPAPVRTVTREVRRHVSARVQELCGTTVDHVDISVRALPRPEQKTTRRVQ